MTGEDPRMLLPPIEPLGDIAWARIERAVWAELDATAPPVPVARPRAVWLAAALGAAATAAAIGIVVAAARSGAVHAPAAEPQWIVTRADASEIVLGDARIHIEPRSAVLTSGDAARGVLVVLDRGAVDFEVAPRAGRPPFVVQAGEVSVRVIGTGFRVERTGDRAHVSVTHGVVEVHAPGEVTRVSAGESWPVETETAAAAPAPAPQAALPAPEADAPAEPPIDMAPVAVDRPHASAARPERAPAVTASKDRSDSKDAADPAKEDARLFAAAAAIEAGAPDAALAEYRRLAAGDGPWAANALYAAARLLYERRDDDGARAALTDYLHRFPHGPNAADARALIARLSGGSR
jgi:hypothetical protein